MCIFRRTEPLIKLRFVYGRRRAAMFCSTVHLLQLVGWAERGTGIGHVSNFKVVSRLTNVILSCAGYHPNWGLNFGDP